MESWDTFAVVVGGASTALLGLLFVAISIRLDVVAASPELRNRAAQTLVLFGSGLVVSILLAVPGQPVTVLGVELMVLAGLTGVGLFLLDRRAGDTRRPDNASTVCLMSCRPTRSPRYCSSLLAWS